ncbi:MAG: hypothetical protein F6K47_19355 [Symploca sp. SIO2E6]|nr:hypothetical protein [Symploca sp. SIO2E6]
MRIPGQFDRPTETLHLELDTLQVKPGKYQGEIIIQGEPIPTSCRVPIQYTVKPITIDIPSELDLGVVSYGEQKSIAFKVSCTPADGKIKTTAFTDGTGLHLTDKSIQLQVAPSANSSLNLEGSCFDLCLALDTRSLEAGRQYQRKVSFQTNAGDYQIPVKFKITVPSDIIVRWTILTGLVTGTVMGVTRFILASIDSQLQEFFVFSYLFYGLNSSTETQAICFVFGLVIVLISWITYRSYKRNKKGASQFGELAILRKLKLLLSRYLG